MRPTTYNEEVLALSYDYLENYSTKYNDVVPMVVGLCRAIKRSKSIVYDWAKDPEKVEFSDIVKAIAEYQEHDLINGSLRKQLDPQTTKMLLAKHGYSDAHKTDHTSSDGSMKPTLIERVIVKNETTD